MENIARSPSLVVMAFLVLTNAVGRPTPRIKGVKVYPLNEGGKGCQERCQEQED